MSLLLNECKIGGIIVIYIQLRLLAFIKTNISIGMLLLSSRLQLTDVCCNLYSPSKRHSWPSLNSITTRNQTITYILFRKLLMDRWRAIRLQPCDISPMQKPQWILSTFLYRNRFCWVKICGCRTESEISNMKKHY